MKFGFAPTCLRALLLSLSAPVAAQEKASERLRAEITEEVQKLVADANAGRRAPRPTPVFDALSIGCGAIPRKRPPGVGSEARDHFDERAEPTARRV